MSQFVQPTDGYADPASCTHLRVFEDFEEYGLDAVDSATALYTKEVWTFPTREEARAAAETFAHAIGAPAGLEVVDGDL